MPSGIESVVILGFVNVIFSERFFLTLPPAFVKVTETFFLLPSVGVPEIMQSLPSSEAVNARPSGKFGMLHVIGVVPVALSSAWYSVPTMPFDNEPLSFGLTPLTVSV